MEIFTLPPSAGRRTQTYKRENLKLESLFHRNTKLNTGITASVPIAEITPAKRAFLPST